MRLSGLALESRSSSDHQERRDHTLWEDGCLASLLLLVFTSKSAFQRPQGALRL